MSRPPSGPTRPGKSASILQMLQAIGDRRVVQLGSADPGFHCLPTRSLDRLSGAIARRSQYGSNIYDPPPGCRELRVQVARRSIEAGCDLSPDQIITTCGAQEALGLCLRAVCRPGDVVALESPTFYGHLLMIEALGLRALEIDT